ncbi:hypothetical protein AAJ76_2410001652 [Vairimorpha ceranae]|uniref:Uncharacterized protein n=1 Tax=Vairimorpha ceranae TaxID=40302 RepID=A0A0F9Z776_9MICR|nr:hypothetical protein AAJ76_2410001652 [Vairimorpha ceranae]KKO73769.1 hypothetical protein AAJ76_2410001652 [Vairimorpha ceranae]
MSRIFYYFKNKLFKIFYYFDPMQEFKEANKSVIDNINRYIAFLTLLFPNSVVISISSFSVKFSFCT